MQDLDAEVLGLNPGITCVSCVTLGRLPDLFVSQCSLIGWKAGKAFSTVLSA